MSWNHIFVSYLPRYSAVLSFYIIGALFSAYYCIPFFCDEYTKPGDVAHHRANDSRYFDIHSPSYLQSPEIPILHSMLPNIFSQMLLTEVLFLLLPNFSQFNHSAAIILWRIIFISRNLNLLLRLQSFLYYFLSSFPQVIFLPLVQLQ